MAISDVLKELGSVKGIEAKAAHFKSAFGMNARVVGNHLLLDYSQIDSPRKHPVADECRGLVVHVCSTTDISRIVRLPFKRFYNYGEYPDLEAAFDWKTARVDEKVDGSLIPVWFNREADQWEIGTRGNAFGDNTITTITGETGSITFRELFLRALGVSEARFQAMMEVWGTEQFTYLFELCTNENKVVTPYEGDKVFLLAIRDNIHHYELASDYVDRFSNEIGIPRPTRYDISGFDEAVSAANALPGLKEGFVITDGSGRRLKVKSVQYVALHHMRGDGPLTPKRVIDICLMGEIDEVISYFPEFGEILAAYDENINRVLLGIQEDFEAIKGIENQKEFALAAAKTPWMHAMFALRQGKTVHQYIEKLTDKSRTELLRVRA